jgi:hypothetical protein
MANFFCSSSLRHVHRSDFIMSITTTAGPRWGRIPRAVEHSGIGKGKLYQLATVHKGLFRKVGGLTLVDLRMLDEIIAEAPVADINVTLK